MEIDFNYGRRFFFLAYGPVSLPQADPNSLFLTGDTCQTIARGVGFRFAELQSMFHELHERDPRIVVPELERLEVNYRINCELSPIVRPGE